MTINKTDQLSKLRKEIDAADKSLLIALAKRFSATKKVGQYKAENNLPVVNKKREQEMMVMRRKLAKKFLLDDSFVEQLFKLILKTVYKEHRKYAKLKK